MKILLDTHIFLWWITDDSRLSGRAHEIISNSHNELYLSAASGWEIAIKSGLGRIQLPRKPDFFIAEQLSRNAIISMPIEMSHALHVHTLPLHHQDPFDRIIIAQAQLEKVPILTADPQFKKYKITVLPN
jgi:PIN domain nuclease of toxin-antitoxin system